MISPEVLRRYPFFCCLNEEQIKKVAMIADEISIREGEIIFKEGQPADSLFLLVSGSIELFYEVVDDDNHEERRIFSVGNINAGEPFGLSSVVENPDLTATAKMRKAGKAIKIDAAKLCALCEGDPKMGYDLMRQIARATMKRLELTRIHLAAARG